MVSTYAKSGTTWTQTIVGQLLRNGSAELNVAEQSLWVDLRVPPREVRLEMLEKQTERRFMKTHLPVHALTWSTKAKYVYVARDVRDVAMSVWRHWNNANDTWYELLNKSPGLVGPEIPRPSNLDVRQFFRVFVETGWPFWPFWENVKSWTDVVDQPNVLLVHFSDL